MLLALAAAILLPEFTITSRLPNVRLEQLILPVGLLILYREYRAGSRPRFNTLDAIFAALTLSTLISILVAPLILHTRLSGRDFYELLKPVLYYAYYGLARHAFAGGNGSPRVYGTFLVAGSLSAAFGAAQYINWLHVNAWLTPDYARGHDLSLLRESGRVAGTIGNPNYFGIFCAMLALAALIGFWLGGKNWVTPPNASMTQTSPPRSENEPGQPGAPAGALAIAYRLLLLVSAGLASLGLVFSGSRTALVALIVAVAALALLALVRWLAIARLAAGVAIIAVLLVFSAGVAEAYPHGQVDYLGRLTQGLSPGQDASFGLRLVRWEALVSAWFPRPKAAAAPADAHLSLTSVQATGIAPAAPEVRARDTQRKQDLRRLALAIDAFHQRTGAWPSPGNLATALVPNELPALPVDPKTGDQYQDVPTVSGYSLLAHLEDPSDPDYPIYGIGSGLNYLQNGNLETGTDRPSNWDTIPGTAISLQQGDALYGNHAVLFRGNSAQPDGRAGIFQQSYFGRMGGDPFTATVWVKLQQVEAGSLELYANVIYADGTRADPLTRIPADMTRTGVWQKVTLGILPPAGKQFSFMGIYIVSDGFRGAALLDGFQLVDGPVALSFAITPAAPSTNSIGFDPEAKLRQSPIIGVGPEKASQEGSIDDEYLLYAARYGLVGILAYLALYAGTLILALRAFRRVDSARRDILPALVAATIVAFLVFNIAAGSFYELQLMAIFWLLTGAALATADA